MAGKFRWLAAAVLGLCAAAGHLEAQGTGRISGRVIDSASTGILANAAVSVVGAQGGTYTRADGGFLLPAVPAGSVRLRVARIGYAAKEVAVTVVADL